MHYNLAAFRTGDHIGTIDSGFFAWNIRWKSAGWAYRNDVGVWVHTGIMCNLPTVGMRMFEMDGKRYGSRGLGYCFIDTVYDPDSHRRIAPGVVEGVSRPRVYGYQVAQDWLRVALLEMMKKNVKYDIAQLFNGWVYGAKFDGDSKWICTELTWNMINTTEVLMGYRRMNGGYPYWYDSTRPPAYGMVHFRGWDQKYYITPYGQYLNRTSWRWVVPQSSWLVA